MLEDTSLCPSGLWYKSNCSIETLNPSTPPKKEKKENTEYDKAIKHEAAGTSKLNK